MSNLITEEEIEQLKTNPRHLSWKDFVPGIGVVPRIKNTELKSGYRISYTIDSIFKDSVKLEHVIIGADGFEPDPADVDEIAHTVLGKCARAPASWSPQSGCTHYVKFIGLNDKDMEQAYNEGVEQGVVMVEAKK